MKESENLVEALSRRLGDSDWEELAVESGLSGPELKDKVLKRIADFDLQAFVDEQVRVSESAAASVPDGCTTKKFEISVFEIVGLGGSIELCGTSGSDWSATVKMYVLLVGSEVFNWEFVLHSGYLKHCESFESLLCKGGYCLEVDIASGETCFVLSGEICVWFGEWKCVGFKEAICIENPF